MSTVTYRPNAAGSYQQVSDTYPDAQVHYEMVDDVTPDEGSGCIYESGAAYKADTFAFPNPSETGTINRITVYARISNGLGVGTVYGRVAIFSGQSLKYGNVVTMDSGYEYTTVSAEWAANPWTLAAWSWEDLNALEIGASLKGDGSHSADCTQIYIVIDYTAGSAPGCCACFVGM